MFWQNEHFWPINKYNFIEINVYESLNLLLVVKDIFSCFFNCVGHWNYIGQYMFWHYEHFWPINKYNFIEINVINHKVDY